VSGVAKIKDDGSWSRPVGRCSRLVSKSVVLTYLLSLVTVIGSHLLLLLLLGSSVSGKHVCG